MSPNFLRFRTFPVAVLLSAVAACGPGAEPTPDAGGVEADAGDLAPVAPTLTSFSPAKAPAGATVTLVGTGFSTTAAENTVTFLGADGEADDRTATVATATATRLDVTVPDEAVSGPIRVSVNALAASTDESFAVGTPLKLTGSAGMGVPAVADSSFTMMVEGTGLTTVKTDYTVVGAPIFGGDTVPFTVMAAGPGYLSIAAPLTPGTYFVSLAFKGETTTAAEPVQVYEWRYLHTFSNGVKAGEPFVKGTAGQEVRVGFGPENAVQGSYTIELLNAETGALVHSQVPNGSSGGPGGTFAVSYSTHTGPLGTFRARLKFVTTGEDPTTHYSAVSGATLTIQEAAP